jgi:hypothetical protein
MTTNKGGKKRHNAILMTSGKFISVGYAVYFAKIIVGSNKTLINKKSSVFSNSIG